MDPENLLYAKVPILLSVFRSCVKKNLIILTLDGHYSHSRNTEVIDCARENGA